MMSEKASRRDFLNKTVLGAAGLGAACGLGGRAIAAAAAEEPAAGAARKPEVDPATMPMAKIGKVSMSRLVLGGNLIGGWAHSRDLLYVSLLQKAYNTDPKVFETLELGEQCGINTIQVDPACFGVVERYRQQRKSKLQSLVCINPQANDEAMDRQIKGLVARGATMLYTHGEFTDHLTRAGRLEMLAKALERIRREGVPAGIGSHSLETPIACEKNHLGPDFYVKTFHSDNYWSATPKPLRVEWCWYLPPSATNGYHDNMWCLDADKTAEFMATVEKPWVAFKVMAAGAIHPRMGFSHAFRNGADVILAGMFDFQIEQDAKLAIEAVRKHADRKRPWRA
jgi:hypothetical protein